jgi:polysaccharide deacetylase 2 family uncharacterized protein YibQ
MTKRKSKPKKRRSKKSRKKVTLPISLLKALAGLSILVVLVVGIGFSAYFLIPPEQPSKPLPPKASPTVKKQSKAEKPVFEIFPKTNIPIERPIITARKPPRKPIEKPPKEKLPKVAIIIDDLGYDKKIAQKFLDLEATFTFSILPHSPFQKKIARLAQDKGLEVMLHLPMEPVEYPAVNPGMGTLLTSMSPDELIDQLEKNLDTLPSIKGVNNHMGSKMTTESNQLYQIFSILKKRGLYFIDSRTTAESLCKPSARLFKIPFAQRDVFIDHHYEPEFIRHQLKELIDIANRYGEAIGIAHPSITTYKILKQLLPELQKEVQLVPASKVVHIIG